MGCKCGDTTPLPPAAPPTVIESRRAICRACPHAVPCPGKPGKFCTCGVCNCPLRVKTTLLAETCPNGQW